MPQQSETRLGNIEYNTVTSEIEKASGSGNQRNAYKKYTSQERYEIDKYAPEHGSSESANLRTLRAHISTCHACLRANVPCVLTCSRVNVSCVLTWSRANVPCVLS